MPKYRFLASHEAAKGICLYLVVLAGGIAYAQEAIKTPLGVVIKPPHAVRVSRQLRSLLPKGATVRLVQPTTMEANKSEEIVVYERGGEYDPRSHVAIVQNGRRLVDFSLTRLFQQGESYAFFQASEFQIPDNAKAFVAAFRSIGDGAGTVFVLLTGNDGHYQIWKRATVQGRFKVLRSGKIQLWDAGDAPEGEPGCVWCPRYYNVGTYGWANRTLSKIGHYRTKHALDPEAVSDQAILVEK
jgi:hypothetical protein